MDQKKMYEKPQLVSRKVELGVFGDYGDSNIRPPKGSNWGADTILPGTDILIDEGMRME